ncbi:MAG: hypothetical protein KKB59_10505 [Spirochaetes bacterium]|nr:hypothetical protein [Spirochaetota bacterium]
MSKWSSTTKEVFKISAESAEASVRELIDFYRVDVDDIEDDTQKAGLEMALNRLQKAYRRGELENKRSTEGFHVIQKLVAPPGEVKEIEYAELYGALKLQMDGLDPKAPTARQHALLGALSGLGPTAIGALNAVDLSTAECLAYVFFMA